MPESNDNSELLIGQLTRLNDEMSLIRNAMYDIREQITWGLQNGRVVLSLADPVDQNNETQVEVDDQPMELVLRLQSSLSQFANDLVETVQKKQSSHELLPEDDSQSASEVVFQEQKQKPIVKPPQQSTELLPEISLFEAGEIVEMIHDRPGQQAEIITLDDAKNSALVELVDPKVQKLVSQDSIRKVTPQRKEESAENLNVFRNHDTVRFELDGEDWQGEIVTLTDDDEAIVSLPEQSDYVHIPIELLTKVTQTELTEHERWFEEVRNPAEEKSEGRRLVASSGGHAKFEYSIAQLSESRWAVSWQLGFHCGDHLGHAIPWKECSSREECLQTMLSAVMEFFSKQRDDTNQTRSRLEILDRLGSGLFGFQEPKPVPESKQPKSPVKSQ